MNTFSESLRIRKNLELCEQVFLALEHNNIDSMKLVDWMSREAVDYYKAGRLYEAAVVNFEQEIMFQEMGIMGRSLSNVLGGVGNWVGNKLGQAAGMGAGGAVDVVHGGAEAIGKTLGGIGSGISAGYRRVRGMLPREIELEIEKTQQAMSVLSKRMQVSPTLKDMLGDKAGDITTALTKLLGVLQNQNALVQKAGTPAPPPPGPAPITSHTNHGDAVLAEFARLKREIQIENALYDLWEAGIDPETAVKFYIEEKIYLNEVFGWVQNLWGKFQKWLHSGGDASKDLPALQNAIQAIANLEGKLQAAKLTPSQDFVNFAKQLKDVVGPIIDQAKNPKPPTDEPADAPADPAQEIEKMKGHIVAADPDPTVKKNLDQIPQDVLTALHQAFNKWNNDNGSDANKLKELSTALAGEIKKGIADQGLVDFVNKFKPATSAPPPAGDEIEKMKGHIIAADASVKDKLNAIPQDVLTELQKAFTLWNQKNSGKIKELSTAVAGEIKKGIVDQKLVDFVNGFKVTLTKREQLEKEIISKLGIEQGKLRLVDNDGRGGAYQWAKKNGDQWTIRSISDGIDSPDPIGDIDKPENREYLEKAALFMMKGGEKPVHPNKAKKSNAEQIQKVKDWLKEANPNWENDMGDKKPENEAEYAKLYSVFEDWKKTNKVEDEKAIKNFWKDSVNLITMDGITQQVLDMMAKTTVKMTDWTNPEDKAFFESILGKPKDRKASFFNF